MDCLKIDVEICLNIFISSLPLNLGEWLVWVVFNDLSFSGVVLEVNDVKRVDLNSFV